MTKDNERQAWSKLDEAEDQARGMFVGGLLLDTEPDALAQEPEALPIVDIGQIEALLESRGAIRVAPAKAGLVGGDEAGDCSLL